MRRASIIIFLVTILTACGLKVTSKINDNVLLGKWSLYRISCFLDSAEQTVIENYEIDTVANIVLTFENSSFNYTAAGACSTSSNGYYITDFNGTSTGVLDFSDILTGGTSCTEDVVDSGSNLVGTTTIPTTLIDLYGTDIAWLVTNDRVTMQLDYFTDFKGSNHTSGCASICHCKAYLEKTN